MPGLDCYHAQVEILTAFSACFAMGEVANISDALRGSGHDDLVDDVLLVCGEGANREELMYLALESGIDRLSRIDSPLDEASAILHGSIDASQERYIRHCKVCTTCNNIRLFLEMTIEDESMDEHLSPENYAFTLAGIEGECEDILPTINGVAEQLVKGRIDLNDPSVVAVMNHLTCDCFVCQIQTIESLRNAIEKHK